MRAAVPELIDIETLARLLDDSVRHLRRLVAERRIPYIRVGHFVHFDPVEIVAWLDNARVSASHPEADQRSQPGATFIGGIAGLQSGSRPLSNPQ